MIKRFAFCVLFSLRSIFFVIQTHVWTADIAVYYLLLHIVHINPKHLFPSKKNYSSMDPFFSVIKKMKKDRFKK